MNFDNIPNIDEALQHSRLLLADPFMGDPHFRRAVVLICEHNTEEGTVGFILNKKLNMPLTDLLASFPDIEASVLYGGPVGQDTLHYVHNVGDLLPDSMELCDGLFWGGDFEQLRALANTGLISADNVRFFLGYSGWSAGQLQEEIRNSSWLIGNVDANYVFNAPADDTLWRKVLEEEGSTLGVIAQIPDDLPLN